MKNINLINKTVSAVVTALESEGLKMPATRLNAIEGAITASLPVAIPSKLTDQQRNDAYAIIAPSADVELDTLADDFVIRIPACEPADKTGKLSGASIPDQTVTFKLASYDDASVRFFAIALSKLWIRYSFEETIKAGKMTTEERDNLHRYKLITEVIPVLQGLESIKLSNSKGSKDYPAIIREFGLDFLLDIADLSFDNHSTGEGKTSIGLTAVADATLDSYDSMLDSLETGLTPVKGKTDLYTYITPSGTKYDVIVKDITERRRIVATRYQFKQSKA